MPRIALRRDNGAVHSKLLKLVLVCLACLGLVTALGLVIWMFH